MADPVFWVGVNSINPFVCGISTSKQYQRLFASGEKMIALQLQRRLFNCSVLT
jgi:hypothetical protein